MARVGSMAAVLLWVCLATGCAAPQWPVAAPMTSPFGLRWRGGPQIHRGVDLDVPSGTPVRSMSQGRIRFAGTMRGFGEVVWIDHPHGVLTIYAHLSRVDVRAGRVVARGEVVGLSGRSGETTGPHLHFEVWRWGRPVDPVPLLAGRGPLP